MANDTNQDQQNPTQDQPPPKQYATQRPGQSGERGTDERKPNIPRQVESSEGDDEDRTASEQGARYDEDANVKGGTGQSSADKQRTPSPQGGSGAGSNKPGGESRQTPGSGSRQGPASGGSGGTSGSPGGRGGN